MRLLPEDCDGLFGLHPAKKRSVSVERREKMNVDQSFWSWSGRYVGYRLSDGLFGCNGQQLGYFAEGEEVYGCRGQYLGEVRSGNRLITNLHKKSWMRSPSAPHFLPSSPGYRDVSAKEMLAGHEDFPVGGNGSGQVNAKEN
jgi:hypothetical protein